MRPSARFGRVRRWPGLEYQIACDFMESQTKAWRKTRVIWRPCTEANVPRAVPMIWELGKAVDDARRQIRNFEATHNRRIEGTGEDGNGSGNDSG